jgi:hypothetical protein
MNAKHHLLQKNIIYKGISHGTEFDGVIFENWHHSGNELLFGFF